MKGVIIMITKIKKFILVQKGKHYESMCQYYARMSVDLSKIGRLDELEHCQQLSTKYLIKQCDVVSKLIGMAD